MRNLNLNRIMLRAVAVITMLAGVLAAAATAQGQDAPPQILRASLTLQPHRAEMIAIDRLTAASDFSPFLDADCPAHIHRAGLQRLWSLMAIEIQQFQAH